MRLWTVQDRSILNIINNAGIYYPDFSKSMYPKEIPELSVLYDVTLQCFNQLNSTECSGLSFTFSVINDDQILPFPNYDYFKNYMIDHMGKIYSMWKHYLFRDSVILELDYSDDSFNPMFVDINDYQYIMPPVIQLPEYGPEAKDIILKSMATGRPVVSPCPSGIAQGHVPLIGEDNVVNVYSMF